MKKVSEQYFCDLCTREVPESKNLLSLNLRGHGVATSEKEICWDCLYSFVDWKSARAKNDA